MQLFLCDCDFGAYDLYLLLPEQSEFCRKWCALVMEFMTGILLSCNHGLGMQVKL